MKLAAELQSYLDESGESMRALSLRAGVGEGIVKFLIRNTGARPDHSVLVALSAATGRDLSAAAGQGPQTYAEVIEELKVKGERRAAQRLTWLCKAANWHPSIEAVSLRKAVSFLDRATAEQVRLKPASFKTYKSEAIGVLSRVSGKNRVWGIRDIGGPHRAVFEAARTVKLQRWELGLLGPFLVFLHGKGIAVSAIDAGVYADYDAYRDETKGHSETKRRRHVREVATVIQKLARLDSFEAFGLSTAGPDYADCRDKFGVDNALLEPLLHEFDTAVAPWARGLVSRDGVSRDHFIAMLDSEAAETAGGNDIDLKKVQLRAARARRHGGAGNQRRKEASATAARKMAEKGFLLPKARWSDETLKRRRGYVISVAKALYAATGVVLETIEQLTDPEFLEDALDFLDDTNGNDPRKGYLSSIASCMRKIGRDFVARSAEEVEELDALVRTFRTSFRGIAPRNKEKLDNFDAPRIQAMIDLSDLIIAEVGMQLPKRPRKDYAIPLELCRDVMAALAHDIQLEKAFRSSNIIEARLDWISFRGDRACITVPASEIKMRAPEDGDMKVVLGERCSARLTEYLDKVRKHCLMPGDLDNPFLFPTQDSTGASNGQPYRGLLRRVVGLVHHHVGVQIHPHLYRHLIGWIWLKDSLDHLPKVQKLLGHKSLQTTIDYYASIDESLALQDWQSQLERWRSSTMPVVHGGRKERVA